MKKLIIIFFMLIGWMSVYGQDQKGNSTRSSNYIEINDLTGFESPCKDDLETIAGEVKTLLQSGGTEVKIVVAKIYPPSVYMKKDVGTNAMAEVTKKNVADQYPNHILILAQYNEGEKIKVEIFLKLPDTAMPSACHNNIEVLRESLSKTLTEKFEQGSSGMSNVECSAKDILTILKEKVQSGCTIDGKDRRAWFEAQGFESRKLGPLKLHLGSNFRDDKLINDKRNLCGTIDYSQGELKYSISSSGFASITNLVNDDVLTPFDRRIIITDENVSPNLYTSIYNTEMITPSCEVTIWLHFEKGFVGGEDEVYIMVSRKNMPPISAECHSFEELKNKYKNNHNIFANGIKIDFRLKNHKEAIINLIGGGYYQDIPYLGITDPIFYAGFVSGFVDGIIETLDLVLLVGQAYRSFNEQYIPTSSDWWLSLYISMNDQRNFFNAFREKWSETYQSWQGLYNATIKALQQFGGASELVGLVYKIFNDAILKPLGKLVDNLLWKNGTFDQGYAAGIVAFNIIPVTAIAKAGKGVSAIIKGSDNIVAATGKNIGEEIGEGTARATVKEATIDLAELLAKLGTRTNLVNWFKNGMPKGVKAELAKHIDDADFLNKLDTDLGNPKWTQDIKDLLTAKPSDLTDKYKLLADDAGKAWEVAADNPAWGDWAKRTFFKDVCGKARVFEDGIAYQTFLQIPGLNAASIVKQVTLEVNGIKVRFDFIAKDANGKFIFGEAKFSTKNKNWTTDWLGAATESQKDVFPLFNNNGSGVNSIFVRATDQTKIGELSNKLNLSPNDPILLSEISSFKLFGSAADVQIVSQTISLFP